MGRAMKHPHDVQLMLTILDRCRPQIWQVRRRLKWWRARRQVISGHLIVFARPQVGGLTIAPGESRTISIDFRTTATAAYGRDPKPTETGDDN